MSGTPLHSATPETATPELLKATQVREEETTQSGIGVLARHAVMLQRSVGNQATTTILRDSASKPAAIMREPEIKRSRLADDIDNIYRLAFGKANGFSSDSQNEVLRLILLNSDRAAELKTAFLEQTKRPLEDAFEGMSPANKFRAVEYIAAGELRPAAKVMIAMSGIGTTEETLWRVLPEVFPNAESNWSAVAKDHPGRPFAEEATLEGALVAETSGWELDKARALARYGVLRPEDKVRVGANRMFPDTALIFEGLRSVNQNTYENSYKESLTDLLFTHKVGDMEIGGKLHGKDEEYGLSLLGDKRKDPERLADLAKGMMSGINDFAKLLSAVQSDKPTPKQLERLRAVMPSLSGFGGFSEDEMTQLQAVVDLQLQAERDLRPEAVPDFPGISPESAPVLLLKSKGGVDSDSIIATLLTMDANDIATLSKATGRDTPFSRFLDTKLRMNARMIDAPVILNGTLWARLRWAANNDKHAYAVSLLSGGGFSSAEDRLAVGTAFTNLEKERPVSGEAGIVATHLKDKFGKVDALRDACGTGATDVLMQAELLEAQVERERSTFNDLFATDSGETAAMRDERIKLRIQTEQAMFDGTLSVAEGAKLGVQIGKTQSALGTYVAARDEFAGYAQSAATAAIGILATIGTGGAAGPALIAATIRAAAASAVARVIAEKAIKGDRFDMATDGPRAFINGATDGAMNVLGAGMAEGVLKAVGGPAVTAALAGGEGIGLKIAKGAIDNGISGAVGNAVETIIKDGNWSGGIAKGLENVFVEAGLGALQGAAMGAGMEVFKIGASAVVGYFKTSALLGQMLFDDGACRKFLGEFGSWEATIGALRDGVGKADGIPLHQRKLLMATLQRHRNKIIAVLDAKFEAKAVGAASKNPESDADLNLSGNDAGARLLACRQLLDAQYPGWGKTYRMALMIGAERVTSLESAVTSLSLVEREAIRKTVSLEVEALTTARRLRSMASPDERANLLKDLNPEQRNLAEGVAAMSDAEVGKRHDAALLAGDDAMSKLSAAKTPEEKLKWSKEATRQQMLANALGSEAYVAPASVEAFVKAPDAAGMRRVLKMLDPARRYDVLLDQIDMIHHQVHGAGGVLGALRNYETYKYIERFIATIEAAGIEDPRMNYLKSIADLHYRVDRQASKAVRKPISIKDLAGGVKDAEVRVDDGYINSRSTTGPDDKFLLTYWNDFAAFADQHAAGLRKAAHGGPDGNPVGVAGAATTAPPGGRVTSVPRPTDADLAAAHGHVVNADGTASPSAGVLQPGEEAAPTTERMPNRPDGPSNRPVEMTWDMPLAERTTHLKNYADAQCRRMGIPLVESLEIEATVGGGDFSPGTWAIRLNPRYFADSISRKVFDEMIEVLSHEVRHAEQSFHVARWRKMMAAAGTLPSESIRYAVPDRIYDAAPVMLAGDPMEDAARAWHTSVFGSESQMRKLSLDSLNGTRKVLADLNPEVARLDAILQKSPLELKELSAVRAQRDLCLEGFHEFDAEYRKLVEEADAFKVGAERRAEGAKHLESVFEPARVRERALGRAQESVHKLTLQTASLDDEIRTFLASGAHGPNYIADLQRQLQVAKAALAETEVALATMKKQQ
jgi:hypothetical protein